MTSLSTIAPAYQPGTRAARLIERNVMVYRRTWIMLVSGFFEPVFYLLAIGFGIGGLVGPIVLPGGEHVPYAVFVAPGLLASSAMNGAIYDSTFVAMAFLGLIRSPLIIFAIPGAMLIGFAFAAVGMAATTWVRRWTDFDWIFVVTLPLFLFSATFYPITVYPEPLRTFVSLTPLTQGVELLRSLALGTVGPDILVHIAYLVVMGLIGLVVVDRRLGRLLLK